ncbi:MAG: AcrR family transcriptional regulator [Bradymonadia bacterium]|jgi:AcrR family transcriptional regulator
MARLDRNQWIQAAFDALCDGGADALRVEPLAKRLGVTKGSFYWHFPNRRSLHEAMLEAWEDIGTSAIIDVVDAKAADPAGRVRALAHLTMTLPGRGAAIEASLRSWAANDSEVATVLKRVDGRRVGYVVDLLKAHGLTTERARTRAELLYRAVIGEFAWRHSGADMVEAAQIDEFVDLLVSD